MKKCSTSSLTTTVKPLEASIEIPAPLNGLDGIVREGARRMLKEALEMEIEAFIERHADIRDDDGCRQVVRNGYGKERTIITGAGSLEVKAPRARDKRKGVEALQFTSSILPPYLRRSKSIDELLPWLYLKGISGNDMGEALKALIGEDVEGLGGDVVMKLSRKWTTEYDEWRRRDLSDKEYVYFWADGVHFNVRLDEERQCILVIMAATKDGEKELIAVQDGYRESKQSWSEMLLDLKARGLKVEPKLAVADGALGFWAALREVFGTSTREQRCWFHKTGNVLNKLPKSLRARAKADLHDIWMAETKKQAEMAFDLFIAKYEAKYPKAAECLRKDRDVLLTFYDFPAEHWAHIRTANPIESTFATVRHRQSRTKGNGTRAACLAMVFKLCQSAQQRWRKLNGHKLMLKVLQGTKYADGLEVTDQQDNAAA
jgi:putative transposase